MATTTEKSNGTDKGFKELEAQIEALKMDVSDLTGTLKSIGREGAVQARSRATHAAESARQVGADAAHAAGEHAKDYYARAENQVRENPAASVGIAAGVGFLVGLVLARK